ncbi:MAG: hypothetical protein AAB509_01210 [Patescibacteria group bacterium]
METSDKQNIVTLWFLWHFYEMPKFLFSAWKNYLKFGSNYFSIAFLAKTLFSPWRRYKWFYPKSFDIVEFFNTLISNTFSRILGAICRVVLIIMGIVFQIFIFFAGIVAIIFWIFIPLIIILGFLIVFGA